MKLLALFMGFLLAVQMTYCPVASAAASLTAGGGGAQGQLPCNKIGALLLADGIAIMNGTTIEVTAKVDGRPQTQLKGKIFKVEQSGGNINGSASFDEGPGLSTLLAVACSESVKLNDGTTVKGPIDSITSDAVSTGGRSIPMSQVLKIHSARVFNFHAKNDKVSFEPTCLHGAASTKTSKTSGGDKFYERHPFWTVAIVGAVGCGIACAIVLPIVIPLATRSNGNREQTLVNNLALIKTLNARTTTTTTQTVAAVVKPVVVQPVAQPVNSGLQSSLQNELSSP